MAYNMVVIMPLSCSANGSETQRRREAETVCRRLLAWPEGGVTGVLGFVL